MKLLAATCACAALALPAPSEAQLPLVGGSYGQTLRVVVSADDAAGAGLGCSALVRVLSRDLLPAAEQAFDLRAGQSGFVDVNLSPLARVPRRRVELLPAVSVRSGACSAGIELYENYTGRTMVATPVLLLPASEAALMPVGASTGQIVRVGVIRGFDPQPDPPGPACAGVLAFADAEGNPVGPSRAIDLGPGGSAVLDLDPSLLLPAAGDPLRVRRFVRPHLLLPASGGGDTRGCVVSVQVYDRLTGWTNAAYAAR